MWATTKCYQSGLVFNTVFATLILGERFTRYSLIGTILVTIGAILIATFGAIGEPAHTLNQLLELLQRRNFIIWMVCTGVLMVMILIGCRFLRLLLPPSRSKRQALSLHTPRLLRFQGRIRLLRGMCYGFVSGILSAHSLLLAKSAVELLVRTIIDRVNQFNRWQSWVILLGMIALALTQLFYLHRGLKLCSTSVLYPFVFCIYNITAILDGLIYFRQASQLAGFHAGLIALGTIVLLSGVLCLSWRLEDIDSHSIARPQSALGPGMGMVEDVHSPQELQLDGEGNGEHQPLLQKNYSGRGSIRQRAPSLPLFSPLPNRTPTPDPDPDSIWAELDDSDYDYTDTNPRSPLAYRSFHSRPRSKSGTYGTNGTFKRHSTGPTTYRTWNTRRIPSSINEGIFRRTSTSAAETHPSHKRRTWSPFPSNNNEPTPWTPDQSISTDNRPVPGGTGEQSSAPNPSSSVYTPLAGPRNLLASIWRNSLRYFSRQSQSNPENPGPGPDPDPENQGYPHDHDRNT